eukprot:TRINITY_DN12815_c0_g1_i2.p2 TRINITY_DN12815_c0_g1~~TRINITY_DN12815_c0_g1_i2.p2  ORF type:complete len:510 (+),score=147.57 TRINITY_DN12815_c0_g1_i2:3351-4880(+)
MTLRLTQRRLGLYKWYLEKFWRRDVKHPTPMTSDQKVTPGYHWLEKHYTPTPWEIFYWNIFRFTITGEVMVGKDWRNNYFFVKPDPSKPTKHNRFARFVEGWELMQDYDTDDLWRKWLDYRIGPPPTPAQCARLHKYQEEKYSIREAALRRMQEEEERDPKVNRIRRYQEYVDQKWDIRRSREIMRSAKQQQWLINQHADPSIQDKFYWSRWQAFYEMYLFHQIDLLRPPSRQKLWKLEDDIRAVELMDKLDNPDYKMNPYETTRGERYVLTPSHVLGRSVPESVVKVERVHDRSKLPAIPMGEQKMSVTNEKPIWGMGCESEYREWFAGQRKQLILARAELEQMKRDGYRPDEVGGDLDPYAAARPLDDYKTRRDKRLAMLDQARNERKQVEDKKKDALRRLLGSDERVRQLQDASNDFKETAVYTAVRGKITEGEAKRYLNEKRAGRTVSPIAAAELDDDTENTGTEIDGVRSVFGAKGANLYTTKVGAKSQERKDEASPDVTNKKD